MIFPNPLPRASYFPATGGAIWTDPVPLLPLPNGRPTLRIPSFSPT